MLNGELTVSIDLTLSGNHFFEVDESSSFKFITVCFFSYLKIFCLNQVILFPTK